jgi:hypothetical protein
MLIDLPRPLQDYLNAKRAYDTDAMLATLTSDAVIADEGKAYTDAKAIGDWNNGASKALKITYDLKTAEQFGATYCLTVGIAGDFPTSPVTLYFYATLRGDKIAAMSIVGEELSQPVATYIQATNTFDREAAGDVFLDDALVNDAKREFRGREAIVGWFDRESAGDRVTMSPIDVTQHHDNVVVRAAVNGNYDKTGLPDPLVLSYYFSIASGKISQLIILRNEADSRDQALQGRTS